MINKFKNKKGFTILESIVAILVLSLAISGAFAAVSQSLAQSVISKDEIKAFYLAQEAIEIIRNRRDSNQLNNVVNGSPNSWLHGISSAVNDPCYFGRVCQIELDSVTLAPTFTYCNSLSWGNCNNLRQDAGTFRYGYNAGWTTTNFKREIKLEQVSANEIAVIVRISWTKGLINKEFKAKTYLRDWI